MDHASECRTSTCQSSTNSGAQDVIARYRCRVGRSPSTGSSAAAPASLDAATGKFAWIEQLLEFPGTQIRHLLCATSSIGLPSA